jgi:AraC-like DNA-binding protein
MAISQKNAYYEHVTIAEDQSYLWRLDDYPWRRCVWNYHPEYEIHLIRHSSGLCFIGDYIGDFEAGVASLAGRDIVIQFDHTRFEHAADTLPELERTNALFERAASGIEFLGETARLGAELIERMGQVSGLRRLAAFLDLLGVLADSNEFRTLATHRFLVQFRPGSVLEMAALEKALAFIQQTYLGRSSLPEVAGVVGMSESAFSRFFKKHTGNTFSNHVITLRLLAAKKLLTETDTPITDICFEAGFSNISNFNRTFLSRIGISPSHYRKAARSRSLEDRAREA